MCGFFWFLSFCLVGFFVGFRGGLCWFFGGGRREFVVVVVGFCFVLGFLWVFFVGYLVFSHLWICQVSQNTKKN